jgi:hypothetical protein
MHRRHPARHDGVAIGHTDRVGHIGPIKAGTGLGQRIDVRRTNGGVTVAAQVVGTVLVGDEDKEVRLHRASPSELIYGLLRLFITRCVAPPGHPLKR